MQKKLSYNDKLGDLMASSESFPQHELEERLRFERLLSDLSARFVNLAPDQIDPEVQNALRQILEFFAADRCTLGLFSVDGTQLMRAFEYHLEGVEPGPVSISKDQLPWYLAQLAKGKMVVFNRLADFGQGRCHGDSGAQAHHAAVEDEKTGYPACRQVILE